MDLPPNTTRESYRYVDMRRDSERECECERNRERDRDESAGYGDCDQYRDRDYDHRHWDEEGWVNVVIVSLVSRWVL